MSKEDMTDMLIRYYLSLYRPSTPIYELLEHKYQDKWIAERSGHLERGRKQQYQTNAEFKKGNFAVNRTMVLRMHQDAVEPQALWTMPKFSKNVSTIHPTLNMFLLDKSQIYTKPFRLQISKYCESFHIDIC